MKQFLRILISILVLVLCFAVVACGGTPDPDQPNVPDSGDNDPSGGNGGNGGSGGSDSGNGGGGNGGSGSGGSGSGNGGGTTHQHTPVTDPATNGTCIAPGKTEGSHCADCGNVLVEQETLSYGPHVTDDNGSCTLCDYKPTQGLVYELNEDGASYYLAGKGDATYDTEIIVADKYQGLPVTAIGADALSYTQKVTSIIIPDSIQKIDGSAFDMTGATEEVGGIYYIGAWALGTSYRFESSVLELREGTHGIADGAFRGTKQFEEVVIPEGIKYVGNEAFCVCENLKSISFPKSVVSIGNAVLSTSPRVETITVHEENPYYVSPENCLIEVATKTLLAGNKNGTMPNDGSIKIIGQYAFCGYGINYMTLPDGVEVIGFAAFSQCQYMREISIPGTVREIHRLAFWNLPQANKLIFRGTVDAWSQVVLSPNWMGFTNFTDATCRPE